MQHPTTAELIEVLPGAWRIVATNVPVWLETERRNPRVTFEVESRDPLRLATRVDFDSADGGEGQILARDRAAGDLLVRRVRGVKQLNGQRWHVDVVDDDRALVVVRQHAGFRRHDGIDVLLGAEAEVDGTRRHVAAHTDELGLTPEEFASLTWLTWS